MSIGASIKRELCVLHCSQCALVYGVVIAPKDPYPGLPAKARASWRELPPWQCPKGHLFQWPNVSIRSGASLVATSSGPPASREEGSVRLGPVRELLAQRLDEPASICHPRIPVHRGTSFVSLRQQRAHYVSGRASVYFGQAQIRVLTTEQQIALSAIRDRARRAATRRKSRAKAARARAARAKSDLGRPTTPRQREVKQLVGIARGHLRARLDECLGRTRLLGRTASGSCRPRNVKRGGGGNIARGVAKAAPSAESCSSGRIATEASRRASRLMLGVDASG